ncbi:Cytochrome c oxidase (B(O/a)3-type) chain I [invertebrate metagenome]|uniref:Cytochrome c oxidase (B(O/a)3-type) chain I n=1 Tax=invertebrate metagenome TaxID=1711999 RepID=A0A484H5Y8_9ZZZZ
MQPEQAPKAFVARTVSVLGPALTRELNGWVGLAVAALAVAGLLALVAVIARTPGLREFLPWPWQDFFPKIVITHVDFSIIIWFLSILAALALLATARVTGGKPRWPALGPFGLIAVAIGFTLVLVSFLFNLGDASLNNYVPVLMHPLFYTGLGGLAIGVAGVLIRLLRSLPGNTVGSFEHGVAATGTTFLIALLCFCLAWTALPAGTERALAHERLFWGGGHILQFVNTMLMLVSWRVLTEQAVAREIPHYWFVGTLWSLTAAAASGILLYGAFDVLSSEYREAFTQLLGYGLSLPPTVLVVMTTVRLIQERPVWQDISTLALLLSLLLFVVGGMLGYFLGVSDTRIPSHYHAVISGVNLAVMGLTFTLFLPLLQRPCPTPQAIRWSLLLYGGGQLILSGGMFAAGIAGVPRKTAGLEQNIDTTVKHVYMVVYGAGGLIAIIGGLLFVWMAAKCLLSQQKISDAG